MKEVLYFKWPYNRSVLINDNTFFMSIHYECVSISSITLKWSPIQETEVAMLIQPGGLQWILQNRVSVAKDGGQRNSLQVIIEGVLIQIMYCIYENGCKRRTSQVVQLFSTFSTLFACVYYILVTENGRHNKNSKVVDR